ncbi:MAG: thiol-disulfide oxidoreductase DCC family protein [Noviherbaspirillum sp.]
MPDIIVFDGICHLCNHWVQFLLKHDKQARFQFAAMQGITGKRLLEEHGLDPADPVSFLYFADGRAYTDTEAMIRVLSRLGGIWKLAVLGHVVPACLRNPLYRVIARNRYRLFGKREHCMLPAQQMAARFLS